MKEIPLTKGYVAWVDDEDFERINAHKWHALDSHPRHVYAARWIPRTKPRKTSRMHHEVLGIDPSELGRMIVDHEDRWGINNQKENLKVTTRRVNMINSEYWDNATGIRWDNHRGKFKAVELPDGKFIGWFNTLEEAAEAKRLHENS